MKALLVKSGVLQHIFMCALPTCCNKLFMWAPPTCCNTLLRRVLHICLSNTNLLHKLHLA